jgi:hypothetical protein
MIYVGHGMNNSATRPAVLISRRFKSHLTLSSDVPNQHYVKEGIQCVSVTRISLPI